jgi:hypothetical protein
MKALPQSAIESRFGAEPTKGYICTLLFCAVTKRQSKHFLEYHKGLLNPATKGYESTATKGYGNTATKGYGSTAATKGYESTATKGYESTATKGYESTATRATESCHKGIYFHVPTKTTHTTMSITRQMHIIFTNSIESNNIQVHPN